MGNSIIDTGLLAGETAASTGYISTGRAAAVTKGKCIGVNFIIKY